MSADSSSTARRHRADPRLPVRSRQLLRVRSVWTIPLIMASVVVAVSCNVATFARDALILADGGYRLARVTPIDQFRYSPHVELVAKFQRP